jgi:hypothetical protein
MLKPKRSGVGALVETTPWSTIPRSRRFCISRRRWRSIFSTIGLIRSKPVLRDGVREFIQTMIKAELEAALSRPRYGGRSKTDP